MVSRNKDYKADGILVVDGLCEALARAETQDEVFVIGGAGLFESALSMADRLYLTFIHKNIPGDTYFPAFDLKNEFTVTEQEKGQGAGPEALPFTFITAERRR